MVNHRTEKLQPGLYFVATPIGTARDITLRALDILASADVIAAEDTRSMKRLLDIHGIGLGQRPLVSYHDHSKAGVRDRIVAQIAAGKSVAYASEAGTPLILAEGLRAEVNLKDDRRLQRGGGRSSGDLGAGAFGDHHGAQSGGIAHRCVFLCRVSAFRKNRPSDRIEGACRRAGHPCVL